MNCKGGAEPAPPLQFISCSIEGCYIEVPEKTIAHALAVVTTTLLKKVLQCFQKVFTWTCNNLTTKKENRILPSLGIRGQAHHQFVTFLRHIPMMSNEVLAY